MTKPLISFCTFGKNDDYMPDFLYRLETSINFISDALKKLKLDKKFEIIILDWASDKPFHEILNLRKSHSDLVRFIYVSKEDLAGSKCKADKVPHATAQNISIRRAKGDYVFIGGADTILNTSSLYLLFNLCTKKYLYNFDPDKAYLSVGRRHIPWEIILHKPSVDYLQNYIERKGYDLRNDFGYLKWGGGAGFIGMHKNAWMSCQGLDEDLNNYGSADTELFLTKQNEMEHIELSSIGICSYHMEHPPENRSIESKYVRKNYNIFKNNRKKNPNWGVPKKSIKEYKLSSKALIQKKTNKAPYTVDLEDKYNHISQLPIFFKKLHVHQRLTTNLMTLSFCIDHFNPKAIIVEESELNLIYLFFAARFYHIPRYYIYTKRFSNIFGRITDSINFLTNVCQFKGISRWINEFNQETKLKNVSNSIFVLGKNDCRTKHFQDLNPNKVCCFYLEFKNRNSLCNSDFRFISGESIASVINSLSEGILIVKERNKEQVPFEYEIKPKIDFVIKMKFRKFVNSLLNFLN